jgi:hypothetical protein
LSGLRNPPLRVSRVVARASGDGLEVGGAFGEQGFEQYPRVVFARRAIGDVTVGLVEGAVSEEELQEGEVRESGVAGSFDPGSPAGLPASSSTIFAHTDSSLTGSRPV